MNHYRSMNRLFLAMVVLYIAGVNGIYYFFWQYLDNEYTITALCEFFAILLPCIYCTVNKLDPAEDLGLVYFKSEAIVPVITTAILLVPVVSFLSMISQLFVSNSVNAELAESMIQGSFGMNFFFVAIIPGVIEEIVFRGVFYQQYKKHGVLAAMLFSAALFGFFHLNFNQFFYATLISVFFTFLVEATGSLWASILAHITINGASVVSMALYNYQDTLVTEETLSEAQDLVSSEGYGALSYIIMAVLALACLYGAIRMIRRICNICDRHFTWEQLVETEKVRRITIPLVLGILVCLAYMIMMELLV